MTDPKRILSSVSNQLYANAVLRCVLLAVSAYILTATFTNSLLLSVLASLVGLGIGVFLGKVYQDKKPQAIRLIHQTVGDAEYSLPLLDKPQLNVAEQLQLERLTERIQQATIPTVVFAQLGVYGAILLVSVAVYMGYPLLQRTLPILPKKQAGLVAVAPDEKPVAPSFQSAQLRIQPPAYTKLPERSSANLNASAINGSMLTWRLAFSTNRKLSVRLVSSRGAEVRFKAAGDGFVYQDRLISSGLYAIKAYWSGFDGRDSLVYQSDFYRLEAQPDLAPKIVPESKELYQYHYLKDPKTIRLSALFSDDFNVTQAFMVATLARGSGENVKFREVRMPLDKANFKEARLTKQIDLKALNFAPGDELYYYWAAFDNRQPEPNFTKSDTYFVVYKDTTKAEEGELATMAVNIMPEYFRSQRQIIIDTEKLLARRKSLGEKPFKSTSNEIGFDQKALRLRYGQFLGEEFEKSIGGGGPPPPASEGAVVSGLVDAYMHKHDEGEGDHGAGPQKESHTLDDDHDHDHGGGGHDDGKDPLAALMEQYVHNHDDAETNTFHEQSTRNLLKMALEQMWQSELHLRLYEPEKALPYEKKALEFLKLSQQKARSFVKKTGFDPPTIKEKETRLTGELKNVNTRVTQQRTYDQTRIESLVSEVLGFLALDKLTSGQQQTVQQLGNALADRVVNSGLPNWSVLTSLQKLAGGKTLSESEKKQLKTKLYELSGASLQTTRSYTSERKLERSFWRFLQ